MSRVSFGRCSDDFLVRGAAVQFAEGSGAIFSSQVFVLQTLEAPDECVYHCARKIHRSSKNTLVFLHWIG